MTFGKRFYVKFGAMALGVFLSLSAGAGGAQVTSRFVVPGSAATTSKITPGGSVPIDFRVDAPATATIGAAFRIIQTVPASPSSFFQITARDFTASIYNDTASGTPDAQVLALPSALLSPSNGDNLGRNTIGLAGAPTGNNLFVETFTLKVDPATPLGSYTIAPTAGGTSTVTDTAFNDYDMALTASYVIVVGQTLTVTKSGTGTGTVTADSGLINCGAVCTDIYPGTVVTLTATPTGTSTFFGWSGGGCSGTGTCVVTVSAATTVNAQFDPGPQPLTVTLAGTGVGTVASAPAGIACAPTCNANFPAGSTVVLTATPNVGSTFTGWSGGGCAGTGTCTVTMNAPITVTATFLLPSWNVTVTKAGFGQGTVTSAPAGINCGATCTAPFTSGSSVTLTAVPLAGYTFTGWSGGGCSGTGTCVINPILADTAVTATFGDTQAPTTTIVSGPTNPSSVPNPQFTFTADESPVTFHCSLDGSAAVICTSPFTVNVGNGNHTFSVFATDPAGNVGNTVVFTWTAQGIIIANVPIPTLNEWMLVLLALILGSAGILARRRRN
jgi:Divergent InlB B-repeat domain/IPTL-CTERM motif